MKVGINQLIWQCIETDYGFTKAEATTYLNDLKQSGITNMFGAAAYLVRRFHITDDKIARKILAEWMIEYEN